MTILEFFDIHNPEHLKAWLTLTWTGFWPKDFIPEGTTFSNYWQYALACAMSTEYVKEHLKQEEQKDASNS